MSRVEHRISLSGFPVAIWRNWKNPNCFMSQADLTAVSNRIFQRCSIKCLCSIGMLPIWPSYLVVQVFVIVVPIDKRERSYATIVSNRRDCGFKHGFSKKVRFFARSSSPPYLRSVAAPGSFFYEAEIFSMYLLRSRWTTDNDDENFAWICDCSLVMDSMGGIFETSARWSLRSTVL